MKLSRAASTAVLALLGSCSTSRFYEYRFQPAPLEVEVSTQAVEKAQVRALVTVLGIERGKDGADDRAVVRMRLENLGSAAAALETESLSLVSADLRTFGAAEVTPAGKRDVAPGETAVFDLASPLPEGTRPRDLNLSGLNLRFTVRFGEHPVTTGASFQRTDWGAWEPERSRVRVGVGVGWFHHD